MASWHPASAQGSLRTRRGCPPRWRAACAPSAPPAPNGCDHARRGCYQYTSKRTSRGDATHAIHGRRATPSDAGSQHVSGRRKCRARERLLTPEKRDHGTRGNHITEGLPRPPHGEGPLLGGGIDHDQHLGAVVRIPEGHGFEIARKQRRSDAPRPWSHEATRVAQGIVLDVARHDAPGSDRHHTPAVAAPPRVRPVLVIERQVPENHALCPVPGGADETRALA